MWSRFAMLMNDATEIPGGAVKLSSFTLLICVFVVVLKLCFLVFFCGWCCASFVLWRLPESYTTFSMDGAQ